MKKRFSHSQYVIIAIATVIFWRAVWHLIDRIPGINDSFIFDILTGSLGLLVLWYVTKSFKHLD